MSATLYGVDTTDLQTGWVVGSGGAIRRLLAGTWSNVTSPTSNTLYDVTLDSEGAWAQCTYGTTSEPTLYGVSTSADGVTWAVGDSAHRPRLLP